MSRKSGIEHFNIRVYALIINSNKEILLADEERFGERMTKFPGGGLQAGEGIHDCLMREALEEFRQPIVIDHHFYTTDFFQRALFHDNQQLISIYYLAHFREKEKFRLAKQRFDFQSREGEIISFRYRTLSELKPEELSFPIDKHVVGLLKAGKFQSC